MADQSVVVVNLLKVEPAKQDALLVSLKENTNTVIATLEGWKTTRLVAAQDGPSVAIISEWETPEAVAAMRADPRMQAYFPKVMALASVESMVGDTAFSRAK